VATAVPTSAGAAPLPAAGAPTATATATGAALPAPGAPAVATAQGHQDGTIREGENFLLPYDRSSFHPAWAGGTLHEFDESPKSLNPIIDNSETSDEVASLVNDSLCERTSLHPELWSACLADSVVISHGYTVYTIHIRPGIYWQRPAIADQPGFAWLDRQVELTAGDFAFALRLILDPAVDCPQLRNYYQGLTGIETPDRYTLRLTWKDRVYTSIAASLGVRPLPAHIYGCNRDGTPIPAQQLGAIFNQHWFDELKGAVGVGRYILDHFEPDKVMHFRRNPGYWGVPWHFDAVEWNLEVKKDDAQLVAFTNGQVQTWMLPPRMYRAEILDHHEPRFAAADPAHPLAGRSGPLGWERERSMAFSYIGWNMRHPPFDDQRVRQAMSYAFPKQRIIREVYSGLGRPVLSDVLPDSVYYNHDLEPYAFDLHRAAALLTQAGWLDNQGDGLRHKAIGGQLQTLRFTITCYADRPDWDNTLAIYRNALRSIGVEMTVKTCEWKELIRVYEDKDFQAVTGGWGMSWDIDYYQLWHSSQAELQGSSNICGLKDARVDRLAEQLRATFDTQTRIAIVRQLQAIINQVQPYTFFRSAEGIFVWQNHGPPDVSGRYLAGVVEAFDLLNPLANRDPQYWHFRP
jgi:peptide/nickel transport system substrate-binding protein